MRVLSADYIVRVFWLLVLRIHAGGEFIIGSNIIMAANIYNRELREWDLIGLPFKEYMIYEAIYKYSIYSKEKEMAWYFNFCTPSIPNDPTINLHRYFQTGCLIIFIFIYSIVHIYYKMCGPDLLEEKEVNSESKYISEYRQRHRRLF